MTSENVEAKVLSFIDNERLIRLTQSLIRIPSTNPPADYSRISEVMREEMERIPIEVQIFEGEKGKPNVCGIIRGTDPRAPVLMVESHMDVVPAGEGWKQDPFAGTLENGRIWGRGAIDTRDKLAIMIEATGALIKAGVRPKGTIILAATVDDETAGPMGTKYLLESGFKSKGWPVPTYHHLLEPSDNWDIYVSFKGRIWLTVKLRGKAAHGGMPEKGVSAIEKMLVFLERVLKIPRYEHPLMGRDTINVGTISGGQKTNIVAAECTCTIDYRFVGPATADEAKKRVQDILDQLSKEDPGFIVEEFSHFESRHPVESDPNHPFVMILSDCVKKITGRSPRIKGVLSAGDSYWSLLRGIPSHFSGTGMLSLAHTNQEHAVVEDLLAGARVLALFMIRVCG
jgi:succinyl-diaminopimelate desuccinylase